ncbi:retrovirus-related pol polyprotein from transposon TNT 1-94 [Tanacetum coccineum]
MDSGLAVPVFNQGDDPITCINKAMAFLTAVASSRFPSSNNQLRTSSNLRNQATIQDDRVTVQQVQGRQGQSYVGEGHMARQCTQPKRPRNAAWYKEKAMLAKAHKSGQILDEEQLEFLVDPGIQDGQGAQTIILNTIAFQTEDLDAYDSDCNDVSNAKAVLMANLSNYGSDVISEAAVEDNNLYAQQDSMILSVIEQISEQMINHVTNWEKANQEKNNESLTVELERYKERVKTFEQRLNIDLSKLLKDLSVKKRITSDAITEGEWGFEHTKAVFLKEIIPFLKTIKDIFNVFDKDLLNEVTVVQTVFNQMEAAVQLYVLLSVMNSTAVFDDVHLEMQSSESCVKCLNLDDELLNKQNAYNDLSKSYLQLEKHCISLELTMQLNQEIFQKDSLSNNQNALEIPEYYENNDLKAQLEAKDTTILKCSTSTCRSQSTGHKKNDRISQKPSSNRKNKVEAQPRKVNKKNHVKEPICNVNVKHTMFNANFQLICVKCKQCMFDANHDVCFLDFVNDVNMHAKSKSKSKKSQVHNIWKPTGKVFTDVGLKWKPTGRLFTIVGNSCPLTRITPKKIVHLKETTSNSVETPKPEIKVYSRRPKQIKSVGSSKKAKIVESKIANNSEPNHLWGSNATDVPSSSSLVNDSKFLGTVRFRNDQVAKIMGYGDYQLGNVIISRVYYVEGLGHNLFSVGQFCDADLEVAFRKNTCFIWNLEGVDLLSGSRDINLYTISLDDMLKTSPICLLSKASKTKRWLWHRQLSHLNFGTLNKLAKDGLARGIPKLKFQKDHMCSACALGKSKKSSHQPKVKDTNQEKLYLLYMDLYGPMHVESINWKNISFQVAAAPRDVDIADLLGLEFRINKQ